jgi:C4-dicarboxylate-specific signal transduction histidine kinase
MSNMEALHVESGRYDLAFASLPEPTLLIDEDGYLQGTNAAADALLGEVTARAAARGDAVSQALPWLASAVERVLSVADEAGLETVIATPAGPRSVAARLRRVRNHRGAVRGAVVVLEDLTIRREIEARQRLADRLAALGTLAAGLAHEVNNPLACVVAGLSFVEAEHRRLASTLDPTELNEAQVAIEEARDAAARVGRIVRSLQSFGHSSAPFLAEVDVAEALQKAARLAEAEVRGRAQLLTEISGAARVRGSESLLVEVFLALVLNAAQAIPAGEPGKHAIQIELDVVGGEAWVVISDTGSGLSGQVRGRAFEPFFTTRPGQAAGLGLSFSHGVITALGGTLDLGSAAGGAAATVRLPLAA